MNEEIKIGYFRGKYGFLSNFYESPIPFDDMIFPTVEHAFQASKTLDSFKRMEICISESPSKAKKLGRGVRLRPDWEDVKVSIMKTLLKNKFKIPELRGKLLNTGNMYLEEGNNWKDETWGVYNGRGKNLLGKLLMEIRKEIREEMKC